MYPLLLLHTLFTIVFGKTCVTPSGTMGECLPLRSCTSLLWQFANPKKTAIEELKRFRTVCEQTEDADFIEVCCPSSGDFLAFENEETTPEPNGLNNVPLFSNTENCGKVKEMQVSNGTVRLQDFPWLVKVIAIKNYKSDGEEINMIRCTGVLINQRYVLFSAQCFKSFTYAFTVRIDTYNNAVDGCQTASYSSKCSDVQFYRPETFTVHQFYDKTSKLNDIGVLLLHERVPLTDYIEPICLPINTGHLIESETVYTVGWNKTDENSELSVKSAFASTYISNKECNKTYSVTPYELCTKTDEIRDEDHELGLPLMALHNNRWYLHGFESGGETIRTHTRVQNYLQWIHEVTDEVRCRTPYDELGECMHVTECPRLMDAFANASPSEEDALDKFQCEYPSEDPDNTIFALKVCCGLEPNFTMPPPSEDKHLDVDVSNFNYCGLQHRDDYFSDNDEISVDEFPWLAVIINASSPGQREAICSGTLITDRYVLTSTQCLYNFYETDTILVRLGDYNLSNSSQCVHLVHDLYDCTEIQEYGIEEEIPHRFYNSFVYINDITLLRLNRTVVYSDYIRPICLPRTEEDTGRNGEIVFATGFGERNDNSNSTVKKKIRATLVSIEVCKEDGKHLNYLQPITKYQMCTKEFRNSTDVACNGDEGGPVMFSRKLQWFLEGISSAFACGFNRAFNHLKIYSYLKWIKLRIKK